MFVILSCDQATPLGRVKPQRITPDQESPFDKCSFFQSTASKTPTRVRLAEATGIRLKRQSPTQKMESVRGNPPEEEGGKQSAQKMKQHSIFTRKLEKTQRNGCKPD